MVMISETMVMIGVSVQGYRPENKRQIRDVHGYTPDRMILISDVDRVCSHTPRAQGVGGYDLSGTAT